MRSIFLFLLFIASFNSLAQGSNNKFLQLRDFSSGGIDANEFFFVDHRDYSMEGSPYVFDSFLQSTLTTKDSATYYAESSNINLISNNYNIVINDQHFTYKRELIQSIEFELENSAVLVVKYFQSLDKFGIQLFENKLKLVKVFVLSVKPGNYRADLNIGSKSSTYQIKDEYYVINDDGNNHLISSKKDVKSYLSIYHPSLDKRDLLKGYSYKTESDLILLTIMLDSL